MTNRFTCHGQVNDLLTAAESEENLAKKRGLLDRLSQEREFFDQYQNSHYEVLSRELRQQMQGLLNPRRFWLRPPLE